jgi:putative addiction module component (TIGR02574 family)
MINDFKEIEHSALELDKKRRAELAKRLIKSLDEEIDSDIEQAWIDEVARRKQEIKSGKISPLSGKEVHKEARKILKK